VIYLGTPSSPAVRAAMTAGRIGCMTTPAQGNAIPDGARWAADNGVFGAGYPGDAAWLSWLRSRTADPALCLFAAAPDVVGDAAATLTRSAPFLPVIRAAGLPAALVAQDGLQDLPVPWDEFDALFVGGSTAWKLSAAAADLAEQARARGLWVHMGRVNSWRRWQVAEAFGCDSCDGTYLAYGPDLLLPDVLGWTAQAALW
jgi:hypothetical protein